MITGIPREIRDKAKELAEFAEECNQPHLKTFIEKWYAELVMTCSRCVIEDGKVLEIKGACEYDNK